MIRLQTLGQLDLRTADGHELRAILAQPKRLALLIYLALKPEQYSQRDTLVGLFWPELDNEHARAALRKSLYFLRQHLGDDVFERRGADAIGLKSGALQVDVVQMNAALQRGQPEEALALYRGDFLTGFFINEAPDLEHWIEAEREKARGVAVSAAWEVAEAKQAARDYDGARKWAEWALHAAPPSEASLRRLLSFLDRSGDRAAAFAAYHTFAERLADEYGIAPSDETRALLETLRTRVEQMERRQPTAAPELPKDTPPASPIAEPGRRRLVAVVAAVFVVLAIASNLLFRVSAKDPADAATRIAVLPFDSETSPALSYLKEGMVVLLSTRLDGAGALRTINPRSVLTVLDRQRSDPANIARRFGAQLYVTGSVAQAGNQLVVEASLHRRGSLRAISNAQASGPEGNLLTMVDDIARQLLAGYMHGAGSNLAEAAVLTSGSLVALKAFLRGEELMRGARYEEASDAFRDATSIDSAFALAYYRKSIATAWTGRMTEARLDAEKSARFGYRLNVRTRLLVEALWAARTGTTSEAERLYRSYVERYPDDIEAWFELAEVIFHSGPMRGGAVSDARNAFEHVTSVEPDDQPSLVHLARIAAAEGRTEALDTLTANVLSIAPNGDHSTEMRLFRAAVLNDSAAAIALLQNATSESSSRILDAAWRVSGYAGATPQLRRIMTVLQPGMSSSWSTGMQLLRAHLDAASGDWKHAAMMVEAMRKSAPVAALATRGLFASDPRTPATAEELKALRAQLAAADIGSRNGPRPTIYVGHIAADTLDPTLRDYYIAAISLRLDDEAETLTRMDAIAARTPSATTKLANAHLAALIALRQDRREDAIALIEKAAVETSRHVTTASPFFPRAMVRRTLRNALVAAGRNEDAERWQRSLPEDLAFGVMFVR